MDLSVYNDSFTLDNALADVNVAIKGNDGDDHLTVKHIGGETKFEGGVGVDTLTVDFGDSFPSPIGDLTFDTETLIVNNSLHGNPVAWQVTSGSVATSDAGDVLLINDAEHVVSEVRIVAGADSRSTLDVTGADGPVTIEGGARENSYENRIELVQGATTVLQHTDATSLTVPWAAGPKLIADDGARYDYLGFSVAISGDLAIAGASGDDDNKREDVGSAYIFRREGAAWVQEAKLTASDGAAGDNFAYRAVAISGDRAIVGAYADDDKGAASGSAYIFRRDGTSWVQECKLLADDGTAGDFFGQSVAIFGDRAIVGAPQDDDKGEGSGAAYVFRREGANWVQEASSWPRTARNRMCLAPPWPFPLTLPSWAPGGPTQRTSSGETVRTGNRRTN